jgi:hypothetical protein
MIYMTKHQKKVAEYLRRTYGAEHTRIESGTRHPKLRFRCGGSEYSYPITREETSGYYKQDLRRMLGEPPANHKLEDAIMPATQQPVWPTIIATMTPPPDAPEAAPSPEAAANAAQQATEDLMVEAGNAEPKPKTWDVKVSAYGRGRGLGGACLWFLFPPDIMKAFKGGVTLEQLDEEHWKVSPGGITKFHSYAYGRHAKLTLTRSDLDPFGSVQADAIESDGEILIYVAKEGRPPVKPVGSAEPAAPVAVPIAAPKGAPATPKAAVATPTAPAANAPSMEARMRAILAEARELEAACPYRLVRIEERLVWQAPNIE